MNLVAITTDSTRYREVAAVFAGAGLEPVPLPCIRVEAAPQPVLDEARELLSAGTVLVLGSARVLDLLWPDGSPPPAPVVAVGAATAAAVRARGGMVEYEGAAGIAAVAESADLDGRDIVFPRAAGTDAAALSRIRRRAASLSDPVIYESFPRSPDADAVDSVAFGSASAVRGWLSGRGLEGLVVGAIGETTAARLAASGHRPDVVPEQPRFASLAEAMAAVMEVAS